MLSSTLHKGQYGEWLVGTIVAAAGYTVSKPSDFGDGIDLQVTWTTDDDAVFRAQNVELQVKTHTSPVYTATHAKIRLRRKHYNALRTPGHTRRYLVLVVVPKPWDQWHSAQSDHHRFARSVLWADLRGAPEVAKKSVTVSVPLANIYSPATVGDQMQHARSETLSGLRPIVVEAT